MTGTLVNAAAILAGGLVGLALSRYTSGRQGETAMQGIGLVVIFLGISMTLGAMQASPAPSLLLALASLAAGGYLGERWQLEQAMERLGQRVEARLGRPGGRGSESFTRCFVTSSLLFVVGPMTIMGSLNEGMLGDRSLLLTKSIMDGLASIAFGSTMGPGVLLSAGTVLVYQGSLTAMGAALGRVFNPYMVNGWTASGGLIILGMGLNMVGATRLRTANLLPALAVATALAPLWAALGLP